MKKVINRTLWGIVVFLIIVISIYYYYGKKNNFTKADMKFLGITAEKVISSRQLDIEECYIQAFTDYYFNKEVEQEEYLKDSKIEGIMDIFLKIEDTQFDYKGAKFSGASLGEVTLEIPTITMGKQYLYSITGYRTGVGTYIFDRMTVELCEEDKNFFDRVIENQTVMISSNALFWKGSYQENKYTAFPDRTIKNGIEMKEGSYYEDGDKTKDYIVLYHNGTFTTKEDGEEVIHYYKVIDYKDKEVHKSYLIPYFLIDPQFYVSVGKFEVIDDHTLIRGDKTYILQE